MMGLGGLSWAWVGWRKVVQGSQAAHHRKAPYRTVHLRIAAESATEKGEDDFRIIHGGTKGVHVNRHSCARTWRQCKFVQILRLPSVLSGSKHNNSCLLLSSRLLKVAIWACRGLLRHLHCQIDLAPVFPSATLAQTVFGASEVRKCQGRDLCRLHRYAFDYILFSAICEDLRAHWD